MRKIILTVHLLISSLAGAQTLNLQGGEIYAGQEFVNEHSTGKACTLQIRRIEQSPVGRHCYNIEARALFSSGGPKEFDQFVVLSGHVTNFHRAEYPQIKTCALSLDGKTSGDDIYGMNTDKLYNSLFSWEGVRGGTRGGFFITMSPETKVPIRVRFHKLNWYSENSYDCLYLETRAP